MPFLGTSFLFGIATRGSYLVKFQTLANHVVNHHDVLVALTGGEWKTVLVALTGGEWKTSGLIAVDLAGDFDRLHEDEVGASVVSAGWIGGLDVLDGGVLSQWPETWASAFDKFAGETGPSGEETGVNSFDPGRSMRPDLSD